MRDEPARVDAAVQELRTIYSPARLATCRLVTGAIRSAGTESSGASWVICDPGCAVAGTDQVAEQAVVGGAALGRDEVSHVAGDGMRGRVDPCGLAGREE
ncbi:hypothetical protein, partial [Saccharothrix sp. ST-888]|uniref:hypothetical protein n=1 Tax=Saccharothrix sp. ST-888 TaxID=1427391 RepID=UPI0005EC146C